jgi:hypothetical protein
VTGPTFAHLRGTPPGGGLGYACFTEDRLIRWYLRRVWNTALPDMVWIMLNPSGANENTDDATIRRCAGYARREGCGSITVVNLFPVISTDPRQLLAVDGLPRWEDANFRFITDAARGRQLTLRDPALMALRSLPQVMCAWGRWGAHPRLAWAGTETLCRLAGYRIAWNALGYTAGGQPAHPLRLRADAPILAARP